MLKEGITTTHVARDSEKTVFRERGTSLNHSHLWGRWEGHPCGDPDDGCRRGYPVQACHPCRAGARGRDPSPTCYRSDKGAITPSPTEVSVWDMLRSPVPGTGLDLCS